MSNVADTSDFKKLEQKIDLLERDMQDKIMLSSLIKGARVLIDETKKQLTTKMGAAATREVRKPKSRGGGNYPPLIKGIRLSVNRTYGELKVHIMGHGYLKWFETGTKPRKTSSGANRGRIRGLNFFFTARQTSLSKMTDAITKSIDKEINKRLE